MAEVTSDLEELQYRWQQIETCCRLDLGVSTSFLCSESSDSPLNHARLVTGKVTTNPLGTASSSSRDSLTIHRVYTYPSLQSVEQTPPPPYNGSAMSTYQRSSSDPSGSNVNASERETSSEYEYNLNQNGVNVKHNTTETGETWNDCTDSTFNDRSVDSQSSIDEKDITALQTGKENTCKIIKQKDSCKFEALYDDKSKKQPLSHSEEKIAGHKKKWWTRTKKHQSEETDKGVETNSFKLSRSKGSLPILSQR